MIYVCSLEAMPGAVVSVQPSHLVSLLDPDHEVATPPGLDPENHLKLGIHDIASHYDGYVAPATAHIESLLAFGAAWDRAAPLLVHCFAGVSRSTAAALILLCQINPGREREATMLLRARIAHAMPNRRMVALADDIMGLGGRLIEAVDELPFPELATMGELAGVPADF